MPPQSVACASISDQSASGFRCAGSGKGLLVRAINAIAFGTQPRAFTMGGEKHELDKRLAAELVEAQPGLFLDNVNGTVLRSETLASVLTERPARVRLLGQLLLRRAAIDAALESLAAYEFGPGQGRGLREYWRKRHENEQAGRGAINSR